MSKDWFIDHNGKTVGPITSSQLKQLASSAKINTSTRVRLGEDGQWSIAGKVKGLFNEIAAPKQEIVVHQPPEPKAIAKPVAPTIIVQQAPQSKPCPYCGEEIAMSALKCRFCNEFLDGRLREPQAAPQPIIMQAPQPVMNITQVTNVGVTQKQWSPLVAGILSFFIPGLGQIYKGQVINGVAWLVVVIIGYIAFIVPGAVLHLCCILGALMGNPYR
jgi:hypothetical protein